MVKLVAGSILVAMMVITICVLGVFIALGNCNSLYTDDVTCTADPETVPRGR